MTRILLAWVLNAVALFIVMKLVRGIQIDNFTYLMIATLVLGLLNTIVRPLLILLTLPVTILTLGLFTLVINGVIFCLAAYLVPGFHITGFFAAFLAALLFSLFSSILNMIFQIKT